MIPERSRGTGILVLAGLILALASSRAHGEEATSVERIENGLLPPIQYKGKEPRRMSLRERMEHYQVPGFSVAVIDGFDIVWARGYGLVRAGSNEAVTPDTLFQAGSISKPVTAFLTLRQVAAERFALDDPVNDVLTSWQLADSEAGGPEPVRLRHLLTHSAGLAPFVFPGVSGEIPSLVDLFNGKGTPVISRIEPPGRRWAYSNPAFGLLQQVLVDASGRPFEELARKQVFEPLSMSHSSFASTLPPRLFALAAYGHSNKGEPLEGKGLTIVPASVGGLWTTPTDLCRFLLGIFKANRGEMTYLLPQELAAGMVTRQIEDASFGAALEGEATAIRFLHGGGLPGFVAFLVGYPETGQGAVVMTNGPGWRLLHEVLRSVAAEYGWPDYLHEHEVVAMPSETFARYAGDYEFERPRGVKMKIYAKKGLFYRGSLEMLPVSETLFVVPRAGDELEFVTDSTGRATAFLYGQPGTRKTRARRVP